MPLAVSWTPLDAAGTPVWGPGRPARLGLVSAMQLLAPLGASRRAPAGMALAASPASVLLLGCSAVGGFGTGSREMGCLRKGWLMGAPMVPLGYPRLAVFWRA